MDIERKAGSTLVDLRVNPVNQGQPYLPPGLTLWASKAAGKKV